MGARKKIARYRDWPIGTKVLTTFVFGAILPILVLQSVSYQLNERFMTRKIDELIAGNLAQIAQRVNLTLQVYTNLLYQIYMDDDITENVLTLTDDAETRKAVAYNQILGRFKQYENSAEGIRCLMLVCPDGSAVVYDFETGSSLDTLWRDSGDFCKIEPYLRAQEQAGMVLTPTMRFSEKGREVRTFQISRRLYDLNHLEKGSIGTVIMSVQESVLQDICATENETESINFILDGEKNAISYPDPLFTGIRVNPQLTLKQFVQVSGLLRNRPIELIEHYDPRTGWHFYNVYDKSVMFREITMLQTGVILLGLTALVLSIFWIWILRRQIVTTVAGVITGIHQVQSGNLDTVIPVSSNDEIGLIAENFNEMTGKVKRFMYEVEEATEKRKNAEIRALESQINPHFLYNTLDSINWMAIEKEEYEISKMIRALGVILRYSVNGSNQLATVEEMVDWLEKYIALCQMRFNDAFSFQLQVDGETRTVKVHKLLLQPFVENAILHGFRGIEQGGLLTVDIMRSEDQSALVIVIEDNGHGMPPELAAQFNDRKQAVLEEEGHIGLSNTFSRIDMYYGPEARWNITSVRELGTAVTLRLPLEKEVDT